jgi:hypothetical protein
LIEFLVLVGMLGWLASVVWQLRLASTKGKVWSRNGYVTRASNETVFGASVCFYWVALGWGAVMLFCMVISTIRQI